MDKRYCSREFLPGKGEIPEEMFCKEKMKGLNPAKFLLRTENPGFSV